MTMKVRAGGAWKDITSGKVFQGGSWRPLVGIKVYSGGAWRDVANFTSGLGTITVALSPTFINRSRRLATITTEQCTASVTGGQTPYTYAWVKVTGDSISITNPSNAITAFQATGMVEDETRTATFRCTATDSFGSTDSEDINVSITRLPPIDDFSGGNL